MPQKTEHKKIETKQAEVSRLASYIPDDPTSIDPLLRRQHVEAVTGLTTSALYRLVKLGDFPKPIQITQGAVGWKRSEIAAWLHARPRAAV